MVARVQAAVISAVLAGPWVAVADARAAGPFAAPTSAAALHDAALAASCANCHGSGGHASAPAAGASAVPPLAGLPRATFLARLAAFASGQREATVMHQIARGIDPAQRARLAAWFEAQPAR